MILQTLESGVGVFESRCSTDNLVTSWICQQVGLTRQAVDREGIDRQRPK